MSSMFEVVIGLEVHVQLNTKSKLFCSCATSFGEEANSNTCPTCLALPGGLPVLNKEAVHKAIMLGTALKSQINQVSVFDRKNYFYPDLPTGYQISQLSTPVVGLGELTIDFPDGSQKTIGVTRAHLENDAGKNIHSGNHSQVDLNRAGTPLLEIVSEPDMRSAEEAILYLKKLHSIVRYLGISDANMQEGSFRCDVNVSIRPKGDTNFYTRCEIKNMNSFRFIEKAIAYEVNRHIEAWEDGVHSTEIVQETRLFDTTTGETRSMRGKEDAADYRYFPDPDLPKLMLSEVPEFSDEMLKKSLPETPKEKRERFSKVYGIKESDIEVYINNREAGVFFESVADQILSENKELVQTASNYITSDIIGLSKTTGSYFNLGGLTDVSFSELIKMNGAGDLSSNGTKGILKIIWGGDKRTPKEIANQEGLIQKNDIEEIKKMAQKIVDENIETANEYRNGKESLLQFFVGQGMKESKGSVNPEVFKKIVLEILKS